MYQYLNTIETTPTKDFDFFYQSDILYVDDLPEYQQIINTLKVDVLSDKFINNVDLEFFLQGTIANLHLYMNKNDVHLSNKEIGFLIKYLITWYKYITGGVSKLEIGYYSALIREGGYSNSKEEALFRLLLMKETPNSDGYSYTHLLCMDFSDFVNVMILRLKVRFNTIFIES
ncbi:MAG: hypothetical protein ABIM99_00735 [Candidatus Dojkabacteria bacterium]